MSRSMADITTDIMTSQMNLEMAANPEEFELQIKELLKNFI